MDPSAHITLAVFPFEDLSPDRELGVFCRSFSTDLITELSRFRQFQIMALAGVPAPGDLEARKAFDALQTDYQIQGTFRSDSERVRINVQLTHSPTQQIVWGNRLEGLLTELPDIQDHLLTEVVGALQQQINADLISKIKRRPKVEFRAYEHWLYGMEEVRKGSVESDLKAREHFERALAIQPDYALACSGMSLTYFNEWSCQLWDRWEVCKSGAYDWAQKAIELDDQNYVAALVLGKIFLFDGAHETAEYYLRKSVRLNPNDPDTVIQAAAYMIFLGHPDEALALFERTLRLVPAHQSAYLPFGMFIHFERGEFEQAASLSVHSLARKWADAEAYTAALYYHLGDTARMQVHWQHFLDNYERLIAKGKPYAQSEAIQWLFEINPHRHQTQLEPFLRHISKGDFSGLPATPQTSSTPETLPANTFVKDTGTWALTYAGTTVRLPEVKGFHDLRQLLAAPGQLLHCATLMGSTLHAGGEKLFDQKARQQYEATLHKLQSAIRDAEEECDFARLEKLQDEYDTLVRHLSRQLGLKGKVREAGNPVEKARSAVTWRIRHAIARIEQHHDALGRHLAAAVRTGTFCAYEPEQPVDWITD